MKGIWFRSIAFKLIFGGCVLTLIPLGIVGWLSVSKSTQALLHTGHENLKEQARELALIVETNLELQTESADLVARSRSIRETLSQVERNGTARSARELQSLRRDMKQLFKALDAHFQGIFVTDASGEMLTGELEDGSEYKGAHLGTEDFFIKARQTGQPVAGNMIRSRTTGRLIYVVAAPVHSDAGKFLGIFGISVKAQFLVDLVSGVQHGKTGYGWMIDREGVVISHPQQELILELNVKTLPDMTAISREMMAGRSGVIDYQFKAVAKIAGFAHIPTQNWSLALSQDKAEFLEVPRQLKYSILLVVVMTVMVVFCLVFVAARRMIRPINAVVRSLRELAEGEGDLTARLEIHSRDEVGELSLCFNTFLEKLGQMIGDITQGIHTLSASASQMTAIARELSGDSEQTSKKAGTVAEAAQQMRVNMSGVAAAMEQSSTGVNTVASGAEEMNSTISEIARNAEAARSVTAGAVSSADDSAAKMNELSGAAQAVGQVVETITDISEQVNLLSLNATIEAARAGEAGKGFAVVANEIKALARQTSDASLDIKERIESIQISSHTSLASIQEITRVIGEVNEIVGTIAAAVEEQSAATGEIAQNIAQASQGIEEVNANVSQTSDVIAGITGDIGDVNQASADIAQRSGQVNQSAAALSDLAGRLNGMVSRFKI